MIRHLLLSLGLLLSAFTQLRFSGMPIGPGEICLAAWLLLAIGDIAGHLDRPFTPAFVRIAIFWVLLAIALSMGTMTTYVIGNPHASSLFRHDIMAYLLMAGLSLCCVVDPRAGIRLQKVAWLLVVLGSVLLAVQLAHGWGLFSFAKAVPWEWDRLRGWSENANQLGLMCIVLTLLSLHLAESSNRLGERLAALACAALPILVGILTKSDAYVLALAVGCLIFIALKVLKSMQLHKRETSIGSLAALMGALALPLIVAAASPAAYMLATKSTGGEELVSRKTYRSLERDVQYRSALWNQALHRGFDSAMLGRGPGPHLNRTVRLRHPTWEPIPSFEAHNTVLDLFVQGGLLAVLSLAWLGITTVQKTLRADLHGLTALLFGIAIFGMTHYVIRHPIVWFVVALSLAAGFSNRKALQPGAEVDGRRGPVGSSCPQGA